MVPTRSTAAGKLWRDHPGEPAIELGDLRHYFREAVLGKGRDFRLGSRDMHGSKDVVELVSKTPDAIG